MQNNDFLFLYKASKDLHFDFENTKNKKIDYDVYDIQYLDHVPHFLYTYNKNDFTIYQINPYKKIKTTHHKNKPNSFCFSLCGKFMFCLYNNKLQVFCNNSLVGEVIGEFYNYTVKRSANKVVLFGNYNIIIYEIDCFDIANEIIINRNINAYNQTRPTLYDFKPFDGTQILPRFYKKIKGDNIFIDNNIWIVSCSNQITVYKNEIENIVISFPCVIKQIVHNTQMTKAFCLCENGKIYTTGLNKTTYDKIISCDTKIKQMTIASCQNLLYVVTEDELIAYFTKNDSIMDRFEIEGNMEILDVLINKEIAKKHEYFEIKNKN